MTSLADPTSEPVHEVAGPELQDGIALCLSGGGYRAMVYHLGALWRLNELGVLSLVSQISSVSGGSITAGVLGLNWNQLIQGQVPGKPFPQQLFESLVVAPIRNLANETIDTYAVGLGLLSPFKSISDEVAGYYAKYLFKAANLSNLPDTPRFIMNATCVKTGALWRFSKAYAANWRIGLIRNPTFSLASVVAASSAFPPFLSPARFALDPSSFDQNTAAALTGNDYRSQAVVTDGGVYDNLGLETAWKHYKTILVSDGGLRLRDEPDPHADWASHSRRLIDLLCQEVSSLRQRQVVDSLVAGQRTGALWGVRIPLAKYQLANAMNCSDGGIQELATTPTRLASMPGDLQQRLINWGYASCDAAIRKYYLPMTQPPAAFPYPQSTI